MDAILILLQGAPSWCLTGVAFFSLYALAYCLGETHRVRRVLLA